MRYTVHTMNNKQYMNNKQHVSPNEDWKFSLIPEPAALCMHDFTVFMTFFSLLIHPAGQRYDTQKLGGSIRYTRQLQI